MFPVQIGMARQAMYLMVHHALLLASFHLALEQVRFIAAFVWLLTR